MPKIKHKIKQTIFSRFLSLLLSFLLVLELIPTQALAVPRRRASGTESEPEALAALKHDEEAKAVEISSQDLNTSEENQAQALIQTIFEATHPFPSPLGRGQGEGQVKASAVGVSAFGGNTPQSTKSAQADPRGVTSQISSLFIGFSP